MWPHRSREGSSRRDASALALAAIFLLIAIIASRPVGRAQACANDVLYAFINHGESHRNPAIRLRGQTGFRGPYMSRGLVRASKPIRLSCGDRSLIFGRAERKAPADGGDDRATQS